MSFKILITALISLCFNSCSFGQIKVMDKIYIEGENYYFIETRDDKNGVVVKENLDTLINLNTNNARFIHAAVYDKYNNSKLNWDLDGGNIYALSVLYTMGIYSTEFTSVAYNKAHSIDEEPYASYVKKGGVLGLFLTQTLSLNTWPLKELSTTKRKNSKKIPQEENSIKFDLIYQDSHNLKLFVYDEIAQKLNYWNFYCEIRKGKNKKEPVGGKRMELTHEYHIDSLTNNFIAFSFVDKVYVITEQGVIYNAAKKLEKVNSLPERLSDGHVIIDKDKKELFYINKKNLLRENVTMRELLTSAVKISLE